MKKTLKVVCIFLVAFVLTGLCASSQADTPACRACYVVTPGSPKEIRIEYRDGSDRFACGLSCAGAMLAAYRGKDVKTIWIREH